MFENKQKARKPISIHTQNVRSVDKHIYKELCVSVSGVVVCV